MKKSTLNKILNTLLVFVVLGCLVVMGFIFNRLDEARKELNLAIAEMNQSIIDDEIRVNTIHIVLNNITAMQEFPFEHSILAEEAHVALHPVIAYTLSKGDVRCAPLNKNMLDLIEDGCDSVRVRMLYQGTGMYCPLGSEFYLSTAVWESL